MDLQTWCGAERGRIPALAARLGVTVPFIYQMANGTRPVPAVYCVAIEEETGGAVRRWDTRPKDWGRIWPELVGIEGAPPLDHPAATAAAAQEA